MHKSLAAAGLGMFAIVSTAQATWLTVDDGVWLGDFSTAPVSPSVNLTTEGTRDWIQWGMGAGGATNNTGFNRKATGGSQISDFTFTPGGRIAFPNNPVSWLYTDGTPLNSADATNGSDIAGPATSYGVTGMRDATFTVLASTTEVQRLKVYVGMSDVSVTDNSLGRIVATLDSTTVMSAIVDANALGPGVAGDNFVFTIFFRADSPGNLTVKWTDYGKYMNAATLGIPEPAVLGALLPLGMFFLRRR